MRFSNNTDFFRVFLLTLIGVEYILLKCQAKSLTRDNMNEKFFELNMLFDYYGELLSDKQRETFKLYYLYDCSLNEIAETLSISKQGVSINLKRAEENLIKFESILKLLKTDRENKVVLENVKSEIDKVKSLTHDDEILNSLHNIEDLLQKR